nr:hypothetical protein Iba_chr06dCG4440 [Ipomoea batatas]
MRTTTTTTAPQTKTPKISPNSPDEEGRTAEVYDSHSLTGVQELAAIINTFSRKRLDELREKLGEHDLESFRASFDRFLIRVEAPGCRFWEFGNFSTVLLH